MNATVRKFTSILHQLIFLYIKKCMAYVPPSSDISFIFKQNKTSVRRRVLAKFDGVAGVVRVDLDVTPQNSVEWYFETEI